MRSSGNLCLALTSRASREGKTVPLVNASCALEAEGIALCEGARGQPGERRENKTIKWLNKAKSESRQQSFARHLRERKVSSRRMPSGAQTR